MIMKEKAFYLQIFDLEFDEGHEYPVAFPILFSLKGASQIYSSANQVLYICGSTFSSVEDSDFSSSALYSIDISKEPLKVSIEVTSCYYHYHPSLAMYKKEILVVVGGLDSRKCEYYSISNKKWKNLPELPEDRYGCSLYCDDTASTLYLFGGYDRRNKRRRSSDSFEAFKKNSFNY